MEGRHRRQHERHHQHELPDALLQEHRKLGRQPGSASSSRPAASRPPLHLRFCSAARAIWTATATSTVPRRLTTNDRGPDLHQQRQRLLHGRDRTRFPTGNNASTFSVEVEIADAELDGDQDIFESDTGVMKVHINNGSGVFTTQIISAGTTSATYTNAVGDLNNDGKPDIYQGRDGQDAYSINTSPAGGRSASRRRSLINAPKTTNFAGNAYLVDLDGDGDNDVAMADTDVRSRLRPPRGPLPERHDRPGPDAAPDGPVGQPDTVTLEHPHPRDARPRDPRPERRRAARTSSTAGASATTCSSRTPSSYRDRADAGRAQHGRARRAPNTTFYTLIATVHQSRRHRAVLRSGPSAYLNFMHALSDRAAGRRDRERLRPIQVLAAGRHGPDPVPDAVEDVPAGRRLAATRGRTS